MIIEAHEILRLIIEIELLKHLCQQIDCLILRYHVQAELQILLQIGILITLIVLKHVLLRLILVVKVLMLLLMMIDAVIVMFILGFILHMVKTILYSEILLWILILNVCLFIELLQVNLALLINFCTVFVDLKSRILVIDSKQFK